MNPEIFCRHDKYGGRNNTKSSVKLCHYSLQTHSLWGAIPKLHRGIRALQHGISTLELLLSKKHSGDS